MKFYRVNKAGEVKYFRFLSNIADHYQVSYHKLAREFRKTPGFVVMDGGLDIEKCVMS